MTAPPRGCEGHDVQLLGVMLGSWPPTTKRGQLKIPTPTAMGPGYEKEEDSLKIPLGAFLLFSSLTLIQFSWY